MVGMQMAYKYARDRLLSHRIGKRLLPDLLRLLCEDAGIDDRPAVIVLKQPKIDMGKRKWEGHAQP
jgi:hypothetical protein